MIIGAPAYFEISDYRGPSSLKRIDPNQLSFKATEFRLHQEARLVEAWRREKGVVVRFITRDLGTRGYYSLICWNPPPKPDHLWWGAEHISAIDAQWWSAYSDVARQAPSAIDDN